MAAKRYKGRDATVTIPSGPARGTFKIKGWDIHPQDFESTDAEFAAKLDKEFMMEDYQDEADKRGITLKDLFAQILEEALEPID